jgi:hypothetical protein
MVNLPIYVDQNLLKRVVEDMPRQAKKTMSPAPLVGLFLIDIPTAAKLMSTTVFAVRELCRSRELAYVVIGHKWLLSSDAIRAFIRKREQKFRNGTA